MMTDDRQSKFEQRYIGDTKTICVTQDAFDPAIPRICQAQYRFNKNDPRIKLTIVIAFEPDHVFSNYGPNITENDATLDLRGDSLIAVSAQLLCNKTLITHRQIVGNRNTTGVQNGMAKIQARNGNLGYGIEIDDDCDNVTIDLTLSAALGAVIPDSNPVARYGGRWLISHRITAMERLSREEWETIRNQNHLNETFCTSKRIC